MFFIDLVMFFINLVIINYKSYIVFYKPGEGKQDTLPFVICLAVSNNTLEDLFS